MTEVIITKNTLKKEVSGLREAAPEVVFEFVNSLVLATHREAIRNIQRGPASGKIYQKYNPRRSHRASARGEYPASDTGRLASSVQFELATSKAKPEGFVGTNLMYGKYLELKGSGSGGRPWLLRSFNEATEQAEKLLSRIFKRRGKL